MEKYLQNIVRAKNNLINELLLLKIFILENDLSYYTGVTGPCGELIYNNKNHKLYDSNDYKELFPEDFAEEAPDNLDY